MELKITVNGTERTAEIDVRDTLLDVLRYRLGLTGTKRGCDRGQCGACTVHMNGNRVLSCLILAADVEPADLILTVESLGSSSALSPLQEAFIGADAFQCGYCTSGQLMSAKAVLEEPEFTGGGDLADLLSGNLCRCGAYENIRLAVSKLAGVS